MASMQHRHKILVVDDNPVNIFILEELLEDHYEVVSVMSGEKALAVAPQFQPDVMLLDIMMPGIDGYETCRRFRSQPTLSATKIIMVSAKALATERMKGFEAGADDYVTKPFDHGELLAKIAALYQP